MNNFSYHYLIETECRRDLLAEADHYRLIKQAKLQKLTLRKSLLRSSFSQLFELWGCFFMKCSARLAITDRKNLTNRFTNGLKYENR